MNFLLNSKEINYQPNYNNKSFDIRNSLFKNNEMSDLLLRHLIEKKQIKFIQVQALGVLSSNNKNKEKFDYFFSFVENNFQDNIINYLEYLRKNINPQSIFLCTIEEKLLSINHKNQKNRKSIL